MYITNIALFLTFLDEVSGVNVQKINPYIRRALPSVLAAGTVREMTLKEQNVDELIARMYKELAL